MTLFMRNIYVPLFSSSVHVEHLTRLQLGGNYLRWQDVIHFLSRCHSFRYLELAIYFPPGLWDQEPFPPFTLPELSHLQAFGLAFASVFHAPNLQSLTICGALDAGLCGNTPVVPPTLCLPSIALCGH